VDHIHRATFLGLSSAASGSSMDGYLPPSVRTGHSTNKLLLIERFSNKNTAQDYRPGGHGLTGRRRRPSPNDPSRATSSIGCPLEGRGQRGLAPSRADLHVPVIQPCIRISRSLAWSLTLHLFIRQHCWFRSPRPV
jgi:hypothetical protein